MDSISVIRMMGVLSHCVAISNKCLGIARYRCGSLLVRKSMKIKTT